MRIRIQNCDVALRQVDTASIPEVTWSLRISEATY
jgi:hypothetical protein